MPKSTTFVEVGPEQVPDEVKWETVSGLYIKWDVPKTVTGEYRGFTEKPSKISDGPSYDHTVINDEGTAVSFFAPSMLHSRLKGIAPGRLVQIEYTGNLLPSKKGGHGVKEFIVRVAANR